MSGFSEQDKKMNFGSYNIFCLESLILAQNERWRHGLGMQVERFQGAILGIVAQG